MQMYTYRYNTFRNSYLIKVCSFRIHLGRHFHTFKSSSFWLEIHRTQHPPIEL